MTGPINVLVVARSRLFREGLRLIISSTRFTANSATVSFAQAFELLKAKAVQADLVVGDLDPTLEEEYKAITALRHEFPNIKIVVLTQTTTSLDIEQAVQHGVGGFFSTDLSAEALNHALELVVVGGIVGSIAVIYGSRSAPVVPELMRLNVSQIASAPADPASAMPSPEHDPSENKADNPDGRKPADLSGREKQILECLASGMSNKLIGRQLDIADATVKVHLRSLLRKLKVQNRTQAAIWSMQNATVPARSAMVPAHLLVSERVAPRFSGPGKERAGSDRSLNHALPRAGAA
jgi:two-component system, NarL family, nitrate/nitrite response regulator NarL